MMGGLKAKDLLYKPEELTKMADILEETRRLPISQLKAMGYDKEIIHGAARYKKALKDILAEEKLTGIKIGEVEKYWPHVLGEESILDKAFLSKGVRGSKPSTKYTQQRSMGTKKQLKLAGFDTIPDAQAFAARALAHSRIISYQNFLHDMLIKQGKKLDVRPWTKATKKAFIKGQGISGLQEGEVIKSLNKAGLSILQISKPFKLPNQFYLVPKEIANAMTRVEKLYSDNAAIKAFEIGYDHVLSAWKGMATVLNPGFHFRNTYSNWYNMWLAGVNPGRIPDLAIKATMIALNKGGQVGKYSADEVRKFIGQYGIRGKGWAALQYVKDPGKVLSSMFKQETFLRKAKPTKLGRMLGGAIEDNARIMLFVHGLEKGMDPVSAAMRVKKYLFDYGELSMVEKKVFRRIIPFYTWMRKNAPLQVEHLWTHTRKYAYIPKVKHAMEGTNTDVKPPYFEELYAMRLPKSASKWLSKSGLPMYWNPNLPFQDLNRIFDPKDWLNSVGPWKAVFELYMNKSIFTEAPLEVTPGQLVHRPWMNYLPQVAMEFLNFGGIMNDQGQEVPALPGKLAHGIETALPMIRGYAGAGMAYGTDLPFVGTSPEGTPEQQKSQKWKTTSWLTGIKMIPYNKMKEKRAAAYRTREAYRAALYRAKQLDPFIKTSMVK